MALGLVIASGAVVNSPQVAHAIHAVKVDLPAGKHVVTCESPSALLRIDGVPVVALGSTRQCRGVHELELRVPAVGASIVDLRGLRSVAEDFTGTSIRAGSARVDGLWMIEQLTVHGSEFSESAQALAGYFYGNGGHDSFLLGWATVKGAAKAYASGGAGDDNIQCFGPALTCIIDGGPGNDLANNTTPVAAGSVKGGAGDDFISSRAAPADGGTGDNYTAAHASERLVVVPVVGSPRTVKFAEGTRKWVVKNVSRALLDTPFGLRLTLTSDVSFFGDAGGVVKIYVPGGVWTADNYSVSAPGLQPWEVGDILDGYDLQVYALTAS